MGQFEKGVDCGRPSPCGGLVGGCGGLMGGGVGHVMVRVPGLIGTWVLR